MRTLVLCTTLTLAPLAACGGMDPGHGGDDGGDGTTKMEPLAVGSTWTYAISDPKTGGEVVKTTTVEVHQDIGGAHAGTVAFRLRAGKLKGETVSWEGYDGALAVRYTQDDYDATGALKQSVSESPYRIKVDQSAAHMADGAQFSESYTETSSTGDVMARTMNWTVVAADEPITVPAGTYRALHVKRVDAGNQNVKEYWFVEGIGKVKEVGGDEDKVLMSYAP